MDAQNPSATVTFANRTPLRIGAVGLKARDLSRLTDFYSSAIGLQVHRPRQQDRAARRRRRDAARAGGGAERRARTIRAPPASTTRRSCSRRAPISARWLVHVAQTRVPLSGASDHLVSEAIYLDDPEGNGIEVYRDRKPQEWRWNGDRIQMATDRLDLDNLAADAGNTAYAGAPDGLRIGHIHLRVGDLGVTQKFYCDVLGLDPTAGRGGALFMSSGRYHHHVGSNVWHSAGAGQRDADRAGLAWFAIEAADDAIRDAELARLKAAAVPVHAIENGHEARDPFGTRVRLTMMPISGSGTPPTEACDGTLDFRLPHDRAGRGCRHRDRDRNLAAHPVRRRCGRGALRAVNGTNGKCATRRCRRPRRRLILPRELGHRGGRAEYRQHHQREHPADHDRHRIGGARRHQRQRLGARFEDETMTGIAASASRARSISAMSRIS